MLIQTPDISSSESNPTGIAHHAHHLTEDQRLQELLLTTTPESTFIRFNHGEQHGSQDGQLFIPTTTAEDTRSLSTATEQSMHAVNGLDLLTKKLNTSCTDSMETSTAHLAQCTTMVQELALTEITHT
jgi:hypothetical protein